MDKLEAMRAYVRVVESGSFTAAADSLGVAKSAISQRVSELESQLGVRLLNRTTRNLSMTDSGHVYYVQCVRILAEVEEVEATLADEQAALKGSLRITAPMSFGQLHLMPAIDAFFNQHPALQLDLDLSDRHINLVEEGFDLALRISRLEDSSLIARRLAPVRRVTVASPAYLQQHGRPMTPQQLVAHQGLMYTHAPKGAYWKFQGKANRSVSVDVPLRARINNGDALMDAAIAGLGISILPTFIVAEAVRRGELVVILQDYPCHEISLHAVYPPPRYQPQRLRTFVDFLAARYGDRPYWDEIDQGSE
jgi:DNA-binding transcriptional LysR family regulator